MTAEHAHRHYWTDRATCAGCGVRRCRKWHCDAPRESGALCAVHAAQAAPDVARPTPAVMPARPVRVLVYAWPAPRRDERLSITGAAR